MFTRIFVFRRLRLRRRVVVSGAGGRGIRGGGEEEDREMEEWWQKMIFPVKRVWIAVSSGLRPRRNGAGLLVLRNDVQTCGYEDVQVMWDMLKRFESEASNSPKHKRPWTERFTWNTRSSMIRAKLYT